MKFPSDYPNQPPELTFLSEFWHPNVYDNGKVCIS
jgi:ubiquitin-protein ligase